MADTSQSRPACSFVGIALLEIVHCLRKSLSPVVVVTTGDIRIHAFNVERIPPMSLSDANYLQGFLHPDRSFDCSMTTNTIQQLVHNPLDLDNDKFVEQHPELAELANARREIQRRFKGAKKANVPSYRTYLIRHQEATQRASQSDDSDLYEGVCPLVTLWTPETLGTRKLKVEASFDASVDVLTVPHRVRFIAIDGETQLAARFEAMQQLGQDLVRVAIHFGKPASWAIAAFVDLNTRMVTPSKEEAITRLHEDILTRTARELAESNSVLRYMVKKHDTIIGQSESYWMTLGKLRLFVACVWRGKPGVSIGSKPIVQADMKPTDASEKDLYRVADAFWSALPEFAPNVIDAFNNRKESVISAPAFLAAFGAIAHEAAGGKGTSDANGSRQPALRFATDSIELQKQMREAVSKLADVNWNRGKHWQGVCGRWIDETTDENGRKAKGKFRIAGGAKDVAYDVFRALVEEGLPTWVVVRNIGTSPAVPTH
jgi:hypothetical protein